MMLLPLVLTIVALESAAQQPGSAPPAEPLAEAVLPGAGAEKNAQPFEFRVTPQSVQVSSHINFDDKGNIQHRSQNFHVSLQFQSDAPVAAMSARNITIEPITTDAGEMLQVDRNNLPQHMELRHDVVGRRGPAEQTRFHLSLNLPRPQRACRSLKEIRGSVDVEFAQGPIRQAVIAPFKEFEGKRVKIGGIDAGLVTVTRPDARTLRIEMTRATLSLLSTLRMQDAQGQDFQPNGWGGGGDGHNIHRTYQVPMPDNGRIVLDFFTQTRTARIPFVVRNIPMPDVPQREEFDVVIDARPIQENAPPQEGQLPVVVE